MATPRHPASRGRGFRLRLLVILSKSVAISYAINFILVVPIIIKLSGDSLLGYPIISFFIFITSLPFGALVVLVIVVCGKIAVKHYLISSIVAIVTVVSLYSLFLLTLYDGKTLYDILLYKNTQQSILVAFCIAVVAVMNAVKAKGDLNAEREHQSEL